MGIVNDSILRMNISDVDLVKVMYFVDGQTVFRMTTWQKGRCGNHKEINVWMINHSDFDHRKYSGSAGRKEEVPYG